MVNEYLLCCVRIRPNFLGSQVFPAPPIGGQSSLQPPTQAEHRSHVLQLFFSSVHQFTGFARRFAPFQKLCNQDQQLLLRQSVLELCCLRAAFNYDGKNAQFGRTTLQWTGQANEQWSEICDCDQRHRFYDNFESENDCTMRQVCECRLQLLRCKRVPVVRATLLQPLLGPQLHNKLMRFVKALHECAVDEAILLMLTAILLLSAERAGIRQTQLVSNQQDACVRLLQKYMHWRHGPDAHGPLLAKLLLTLPELRELAELFADCPLEQLQQQRQQQQNRCSSSSCEGSNSGSGSECDGCESDESRIHSPMLSEEFEPAEQLQQQLDALALSHSQQNENQQSLTQVRLEQLSNLIHGGRMKLFSIQEMFNKCT